MKLGYLDLEVKYTEYAGHARELMLDDSIKQYYAVVTVSGDGLIHEVINGLMC